MYTSLYFHKHCTHVSNRIDKKNTMLTELAGSSWEQDKETLQLTYNALGKYIASYAVTIWSPNTSDSNFKNIQTAQNAAQRTATGANKMASIDHLLQKFLTLKVGDHWDMLSAKYLLNCLQDTTSVMASQVKSQDLDPWRRISTQDITPLFFLDSA